MLSLSKILLFFIFLDRITCLMFFFTQMTAYELRISDWSSDVCSSDLPDTRDLGGYDVHHDAGDQRREPTGHVEADPLHGDHALGDGAAGYDLGRSEEPRVGKECVRTCSSG